MSSHLMRYALISQQLLEWMEHFALQYGYFGVFLLSLIGACSIIFPIPYLLLVYFMGSLLDPFLLAVASGLGSTLGELSGYALGYYGRAMISEERKRKMDFMLKICDRYGTVVIFIFALTPLPDDLLFIPLGMIRCSLLKAFLPCVLGKFLMCLALAMGGKLSITFIKDLMGGDGWWGTVATMMVLFAVIVIILKIDWEKIFTQYIERRHGKSEP